MLLAIPTWSVYVGAFLFVLGILVFVHELGHFLAAKSVGIHVHRFSIGVGSPVRWLTKKWRGTEYCVSWLPLGGYVKMAGLEEEGTAGSVEGPQEDEEAIPNDQRFDYKPLPARFLVIIAGVTMNLLFAFAVYSIRAATVGDTLLATTVVDMVLVDSLPPRAEALAGLERGDRIVAINGDSIRYWRDIGNAFLNGPEDLTFEIDGKPAITIHIPTSAVDARSRAGISLIPDLTTVIAGTLPNSPAERAGFEPGDTIVAIDDRAVESWRHMASTISISAGDTLDVLVHRAGGPVQLTVIPDTTLSMDTTASGRRVAQIGIRPRPPEERITYAAGPAVAAGFHITVVQTRLVLNVLKGLFLGQVSPRQLGGPVLIGQLSGEQAQLGWERLLAFMAFLSINLAVINLLPIPVLDGGHVVFLLMEAVRRKPLSIELRARLTQVGFFIIIGIMLFALSNDLLRVFGL